MSKTYKTGAPWHLWFIALFFIFVYANGVYDYFMMLGHNMDYYEAKGFGEETYKYFTNYPIGLLVFWTTNILCGITSPILLLFLSRLTVCVSFISSVFFFLFVYAICVYDYFMMLGHNIDYYEAKGFGEETYKYFTNYPIGLLVFWTTNILCGITSPILLLFRSRLTVWVAFISAVSMFLL